jgi:hypothetical protein
MRFQVGKFVCELSRDHTGKVLMTWFRKTEPPKYLNRVERTEYQAGRAAFLESVELSGEGSPRHVAREG